MHRSSTRPRFTMVYRSEYPVVSAGGYGPCNLALSMLPTRPGLERTPAREVQRTALYSSIASPRIAPDHPCASSSSPNSSVWMASFKPPVGLMNIRAANSASWLASAVQRRGHRPSRAGSVLAADRVAAGASYLRHIGGVLAAHWGRFTQPPIVWQFGTARRAVARFAGTLEGRTPRARVSNAKAFLALTPGPPLPIDAR